MNYDAELLMFTCMQHYKNYLIVFVCVVVCCTLILMGLKAFYKVHVVLF